MTLPINMTEPVLSEDELSVALRAARDCGGYGMEEPLTRILASHRALAAKVEELTKDIEQGFMDGAYARLKQLQDAERHLVAAQEQLKRFYELGVDCQSNSCRYAQSITGMRHNGPCKCKQNYYDLPKERDTLQARVTELEEAARCTVEANNNSDFV